MAKHQNLSAYQQGIVRRYYEHAEGVAAQKLAELVSELYLATDEKKAARLWKSAEAALAKTPVDAARAQAVVQSRDVRKLAELAALVAPGGKKAT
ncbi:MAG: hypothetical protein SFZ24_05030 [Planctomycetota bacterium]|nr:hypothetical protein [Planctomycetota bacterium]